MEIHRCDCSRHGLFTIFCIQKTCQLSRRLCGACRKHHSNHATIQFDDPQSFQIYSINAENPNREHIRAKLNKAVELAKFTKDKILQDLQTMIQLVNEIFDDRICGPLQTLIGTTFSQYHQNKWNITAGKQMNKKKLSLIAEELTVLNKPYFKKSKWLNSLGEHIAEDLAEIRKFVEQHLQQAKLELNQIQSLSPFSDRIFQQIENKKERKILDGAILKFKKATSLMQKKEMDMDYQKVHEKTPEWLKKTKVIEQKQKEQISNFLRKFSKNVIGWYSYVSVDEWIKNKKLEEIQDLNLNKTNLGTIPIQLGLFPNIKRIILDNNNITEIINLENSTTLQVLRLYQNSISEIKGLDNLSNLQILNLHSNNITEMKGLEKLTNLKELYLRGNPISQIKNLDNLVQIERLYLDNCNINKLQNIHHLSKLKELYIFNNPLMNNEEQKKRLQQFSSRGIQIS